MDNLVERLRHLRIVLKSGEYDGGTLMEAWCAMAQAADELERLQNAIATCPTPFCANADRVIWQPDSAGDERG